MISMGRFNKVALFLVLVVIFLSSLQNIYAQKKIVVLGDSLSSGHGIDVNKGWVKLLANKLNQSNLDYSVVNASISGDTTKNGLNRLPKLLKREKPDIVIIELGGNDGLRGLSLTQFKSNLSQLVEKSKASGAKVLLVGVRMPPNFGRKYQQRFQETYISVAKQYKVPLVPQFLENIAEHPNLMQKDEIHPNEQAQTIMLNNIWPQLFKLVKSIVAL